MTSSIVQASPEQDRYVKKLKLSATQTAVVAEGDYEARSIGSYSVRVYSNEDAQLGDDTTFFTDGVIVERDGYIEKVVLADIDGDESDELVVGIRSAGTGGYQLAHAFTVSKTKVFLMAAVADLPPGSDLIIELKKANKKRK
ncbi:MAG TPA: PliI family lysozyme inhibitor of I-type lysozyme [Deferrisomatales bacterium]|nr:PliI family lysozyme inhibitor of I-type lysozyme [Deferrisomatales bacterium]